MNNDNAEVFDYEAIEPTAEVETKKKKKEKRTTIKLAIGLVGSIAFAAFIAGPLGGAIGTAIGEQQAKEYLATADYSYYDPAPSRSQYAVNLFGLDSGENVKVSIQTSDGDTLYKERIKANSDGAVAIAGVMDSGYKTNPAFYNVSFESNAGVTSIPLDKNAFTINEAGEASVTLEYNVQEGTPVLGNFAIEDVEIL